MWSKWLRNSVYDEVDSEFGSEFGSEVDEEVDEFMFNYSHSLCVLLYLEKDGHRGAIRRPCHHFGKSA